MKAPTAREIIEIVDTMTDPEYFDIDLKIEIAGPEETCRAIKEAIDRGDRRKVMLYTYAMGCIHNLTFAEAAEGVRRQFPGVFK